MSVGKVPKFSKCWSILLHFLAKKFNWRIQLSVLYSGLPGSVVGLDLPRSTNVVEET